MLDSSRVFCIGFVQQSQKRDPKKYLVNFFPLLFWEIAGASLIDTARPTMFKSVNINVNVSLTSEV
jgi:hypothetical protein